MNTLGTDLPIMFVGSQFIGAFVNLGGCPIALFAGALEVLEMALEHDRLHSLPRMKPLLILRDELRQMQLDEDEFELLEFPIGTERLPSRGSFTIPTVAMNQNGDLDLEVLLNDSVL